MKQPPRSILRFVLAALVFAPSIASCAQEQPAPDAAAPRNVILFIGDGMGVPLLGAASDLLEDQGRHLTMLDMPVTGLSRTNTVDSLVTESAAGGTALATGYKTLKGRVSVSADSLRLKTLVEAAQEAGFKTGILTTTNLLDATPASFGAHALSRRQMPLIARQFAASGIDVLAGGGSEAFTDEAMAAARNNGYQIVHDGQLAGVDGGRWLGLFSERAPHTEAYGPPLVEVFDKALATLSGGDAPFMLVVEQEETDTGSHANDLPRVLDGFMELDAAIDHARTFAHDDGHTLVLVTADHDTGGLSILDTNEQPTWSTHGHTGGWVPVLADGPGAERFTGIHQNTYVPVTVAGLLSFPDFPAERSDPSVIE